MTVDRLLADPSIEIVVNLTVPAAHVEVGLRAISAGKHVHSEKPLALGTKQARTLLDLAADRGLRVGCAPDTFLGGAHQTCRKLVDETPERYFYPNQYANESNPRGHYEGTGQEIWEQTGGRVTHFVAGIGTSGTVMGTSRRLKDYRLDLDQFVEDHEAKLRDLQSPHGAGF